MNADAAFEAYLARLYVDADERAKFLDDPARQGRLHGLNETQCAALETIDRVGLEMAAESFTRKRRGSH